MATSTELSVGLTSVESTTLKLADADEAAEALPISSVTVIVAVLPVLPDVLLIVARQVTVVPELEQEMLFTTAALGVSVMLFTDRPVPRLDTVAVNWRVWVAFPLTGLVCASALIFVTVGALTAGP